MPAPQFQQRQQTTGPMHGSGEAANASGQRSAIQLKGKSLAEQEAALRPENNGYDAQAARLVPGQDNKAPAARPKAKPAALPKGVLDEAQSKKALQDAFGSYKTIASATSLKILSDADFEKKWDEMTSPGDYKTVGPLEGFESGGDVYINAKHTSVDTIAHELLHANVAADWTGVVGSEFDEGSTEFLTIYAMRKAGKTPTHSYPSQEECVKHLIGQGLPRADLFTAYLKSGARKLIATFVDDKCKGTWAEAKAAMQAEDWTKAKLKMMKK